MATPVVIRVARAADSTAIAGVHVASWREGYEGLLPTAFLASLSVESYAGRWRDTLGTVTPQSPTTLVAVVAERMVGFCSVGPSRDDDADPTTGELLALYVHPTMWRHGVATALHERAMAELHRRRLVSATLWVLARNTGAQGFYRSLGWVSDEQHKTDWRGDIRLDEVRYRRGNVFPGVDRA